MKARELMRLMHEAGEQHGSGSPVDCDTIAEAEEYLSRYPSDRRGYATCATIKGPKNVVMSILQEAGYTWNGDKVDPKAYRPGFVAHVTLDHRQNSPGEPATLLLNPTGAAEALASGPAGYLHPGDRPTDD